MTIYRGPGGTGTASSEVDTTEYQEFLVQAQAAKEAAEAARDAALAAETNAETAETNAELAETNAETAETNASASASAAASSASAAATSASNAATSASSAASSAVDAAASAASVNDTNLVHISGTETITGVKTFSNTIVGSVSGNAATVTNGVITTGSYANPSWLTSLAWSKVTNTPTTIAGYGITNAYTKTEVDASLATKQAADTELTTLAGMSSNRATFLTSNEGFGFRNRIINGNMVIDQRNAGASVSSAAGGTYFVDRWRSSQNQNSKFSAQQNAGAVTPPAGFTNYLGITSSSAYSVLTGDYIAVGQRVEGFNAADLGWGSAGAQSVTLSFWVRSSLTGTFGGAVANSGSNRAYPFTYTISAANTWELETITIPGDTTGTWLTTNGVGIALYFNLGSGATFSGTAGAWAAADYVSATGATSVVGTNGATFYITGVQLEAGSVASPFERRPYGTELALCQRYYAKLTGAQFAGFGSGYYRSGTAAYVCVRYPVTMRASPTASQSSTQLDDSNTNIAVTGISTSFYGPDSAMLALSVASGGTQYRPVTFGSNNTTSGFVDFSAEL